ncbi:ArsR/SmtB family transcription factor [Dyadobacter jiangsuensis]|uniref:ArsR family transcriptional regulator n=1 Tax=Dyadobacter jiangsuensis TaxID=1591085 RepID=A0A2P8G181_9BACT|nr:metalloregulator ArsR/SmtB family transcription factor [Dyadobacter jiangsuensis]PSL27740.1 ArsR family transcriptional regulator [Dyadobacter jiangsuensis]
MKKQEFKSRIYTELAMLAKAMSNPHRLQIIDLLAQGSRTVEEIADQLSISIANTSQHLQVLKGANLVAVDKQGHYAHYRLANDQVLGSWHGLRDLGINRMAEIDRTLREFREERDSFASVSINELLEKINLDNVLILDVRPHKEYNAGHISGAISIPIDELPQQLANWPKDKETIVYCRGPFCVFADDAVQMLSQKGIPVRRLEEGFPDWKLRNLPVGV